jgi:hypothetical protein
MTPRSLSLVWCAIYLEAAQNIWSRNGTRCRPSLFAFSESGSLGRCCQTIWRIGNKVGVRFVSVLDWIIAHTGDLAFGRLNSSQGSRMCFAPLTAGVCNVCHWFIKSDAFANATGEAAMGPDDRRSSIRRSGKDRRSGADTRSEREQRSVGERRSQPIRNRSPIASNPRVLVEFNLLTQFSAGLSTLVRQGLWRSGLDTHGATRMSGRTDGHLRGATGPERESYRTGPFGAGAP